VIAKRQRAAVDLSIFLDKVADLRFEISVFFISRALPFCAHKPVARGSVVLLGPTPRQSVSAAADRCAKNPRRR
jgi:hypothetical protein